MDSIASMQVYAFAALLMEDTLSGDAEHKELTMRETRNIVK